MPHRCHGTTRNLLPLQGLSRGYKEDSQGASSNNRSFEKNENLKLFNVIASHYDGTEGPPWQNKKKKLEVSTIKLQTATF